MNSAAPTSRSATRSPQAPEGEVRTYYDRPVLAPPVWTWEVPTYVFTGGTAGAAAVVAALATSTDRAGLARAAGWVAAAGAAASPPLLIADLGRPERFYNMLRVFKPTSPMSVGSWLLAVFGPAALGSAALRELGWLPRLQRLAEVAAALLGPPMTTYTAVLVADTAVPIWREARRELPLVFAGSSAAAGGAAAAALSPADADAEPARRLALTGAALAIGGGAAMERRLGFLARPYREGTAGMMASVAKAATVGGASLLAASGSRRVPQNARGRARRWAGLAGSGLLVAGSVCERWAIFRAGHASASDPTYLVRHQRERLASRETT